MTTNVVALKFSNRPTCSLEIRFDLSVMDILQGLDRFQLNDNLTNHYQVQLVKADFLILKENVNFLLDFSGKSPMF